MSFKYFVLALALTISTPLFAETMTTKEINMEMRHIANQMGLVTDQLKILMVRGNRVTDPDEAAIVLNEIKSKQREAEDLKYRSEVLEQKFQTIQKERQWEIDQREDALRR